LLVLTAAAVGMLGAAPAAHAVTFSSAVPITIQGPPVGSCPAQTPANPYPSGILSSGLTGTITDVNVTLTGFTHDSPGSLRIMVVGPDGVPRLLLNNTGGVFPVTNATVTFDDEAAGPVPSPIVSGTYQPTANDICTDPPTTVFPAPAPQVGPTLGLSGLDGTNPNGTWNLYVVTDDGFNQGSIGGWSVDITTGAAPPTPVTRTVDDNLVQCPTAAYTTIQSAVDAAGPGDTINVCRGTYTEAVSIGAGKDNLSLVSSTAAAAAIVQGGFAVDGAQGVSIQKFRVEPTAGGAGIAVATGSSTALIRSNLVVGGLIGIHVVNADAGTVRDNSLNGQTQQGIAVIASALGVAKADVLNNTVIGTAESSGIYLVAVAGDLTTTAFGNTVSKNGAYGVYVQGASGGTGTVAVKANSVSAGGAGMTFGGSLPATVENNNVSANSGGGISANSGGHTFKSNNAKGNGGTDCQDSSTGTGTAGTGNTWTGNYGLESNPVGICKK
jgi:hypothetical protein